MHVQGDAAVVCVTRGLQQVIAAEEDHIQRLKLIHAMSGS